MKYHVDVSYLWAEVEANSEEEARNKVYDALNSGFGEDAIVEWEIEDAWPTEGPEAPITRRPTMQELEDFFLER